MWSWFVGDFVCWLSVVLRLLLIGGAWVGCFLVFCRWIGL